MSTAEKPKGSLAEALQRVYPELDAVRAVAAEPVYLVGGAVRDLLLGRGRADIDVVVEGDAAALAARLGVEPVAHERFGTAKVSLDGHELDIASARSETYEYPGALPAVEPAAAIAEDLGRRDFTINAMAIPLRDGSNLIDPFGGQADLTAGLLRVLHPGSFVDDPTRALRAARYAARFGFRLEPETEALLRKANLTTVSADRRDAELLRLAGEAEAPRAFQLAEDWGLIVQCEGGPQLVARAAELLAEAPWRGFVPRDRALFAAALDARGGEEELAAASPARPSEAVALAAHHSPLELLLARARGAEWLDDYLEKWSRVELEIDGNDLIAAGVTEGRAVGRGLAEAKRRKLDGEIAGRDQELDVALAAARGDDGVA